MASGRIRQALERRGLRDAGHWLLLGLLPVQGLHMVEHTAQLAQHLAGTRPAHGLLGSLFDTVAVHVVFNVGILAILLGAAAALPRAPGQAMPRSLLAILLFQGYHALEHVVQAYQHWVLGMGGPPGLIGYLAPNPVAHFVLNGILTGLLVLVWWQTRPRRTTGAVTPTGA